MMSPDIIAAIDALLRVVVERERERLAKASATTFKARPFEWRDPKTIRPRSAPDLAGLASDPVGTTCRAELRRLGEMIHADGGDDALDEAVIKIAEMQITHSEWRWMVLESVWIDIGRGDEPRAHRNVSGQAIP